MTKHRMRTATLAALALAAQAALAPAETIVTTPFRGVTHIQRTETSPRLVVMNIVQIDLSDPGIGFLTTPGNGSDPGEFTGQKTSQFVAQHGLQIGLNGDFYSLAGTGPNGEIYRNVTNLAASNGSNISPWPSNPGTIRGAINISANNVPTLVRPASNSGETFNTNPALTPYNAIGGSDRMINNGNIILTSAFANEIHPRTVIGYNATHFFLFTVDGRQAGYSEGMNLYEIANVLKNDYGVTHALNLDGGGSTTLVMQDPVLRVVNRPSDGSERTNGNNLGVYAVQWPQWAIDGNGAWSVDANWSGPKPNAVGDVANFRAAISVGRTVTIDAPTTVGTINFEHNKSYTIDGLQQLTLDVALGSAAINVTTPATHVITAPLKLNDPLDVSVGANAFFSVGGSFDNSSGKTITKSGAGSLTISGPQTYGPGSVINVDEGTLSLNSNAGGPSAANLTLNANSTTNFAFTQNLAALHVGAGVTATISPGANKTMKTGVLDIASDAKLNVNDNNVIVNYSGGSTLGSWDGSKYTGVTGLIQSGHNNGAWNGPGITSASAAASGGLKALVPAEASHVLGISGTQTALWSGYSVDATSVLVMFTFAGDADGNGTLDGDDYFRIDSAVALSGSVFGYHNGDFNFDGAIDGDDYFILDGNIAGANSAGFITPVPEPASLAACAFAACALVRRRRP